MVDGPFTAALREAVRGSGLSLTEIEARAGVPRASLSRFLAGKRSLRLDVADRLATFFALEVRRAELPNPLGS